MEKKKSLNTPEVTLSVSLHRLHTYQTRIRCQNYTTLRINYTLTEISLCRKIYLALLLRGLSYSAIGRATSDFPVSDVNIFHLRSATWLSEPHLRRWRWFKYTCGSSPPSVTSQDEAYLDYSAPFYHHGGAAVSHQCPRNWSAAQGEEQSKRTWCFITCFILIINLCSSTVWSNVHSPLLPDVHDLRALVGPEWYCGLQNFSGFQENACEYKILYFSSLLRGNGYLITQ